MNTKPHASAPEEASGVTQSRKPYSTPRLEVYGDLAAITKAHANGSKNDGGFGFNKHTTP